MAMVKCIYSLSVYIYYLISKMTTKAITMNTVIKHISLDLYEIMNSPITPYPSRPVLLLHAS